MNHSKNEPDFRFDLLSDHSEEDHFHSQAELVYVLHSTVKMQIEGESRTLSPEDLLLVNASRRHSLLVPEDALVCRLHISFSLLRSSLGREHIFFRCDSTDVSSEYYLSLRVLLRQMLNSRISQPRGSNFLLKSSSTSAGPVTCSRSRCSSSGTIWAFAASGFGAFSIRPWSCAPATRRRR